MDLSSVCRTCISNTDLEPIFHKSSDFTQNMKAITGLNIEMNDGLPQNMCLNCLNFIYDSIKFRKRCKSTELQLFEYLNNIKREVKVKSEDDNFELKNSNLDTDYEVKNEFNDSESNFTDDDKPLKCLLKVSTESPKLESKEVQKKKVKLKSTKRKNTELPYETITDSETLVQRVTCKLCQKNLSIRSIDTHVARCHPGADVRKVKCDLCDTMVLKEKMKRHQSMMHGTEAFKCSYCKTDYGNKELLIAHVESCSAKKKRRKACETGRRLIECDICHKTMQKASLKLHKAIKHSGLGPVCEHCGKRLGNKFRLNEHLRAKHGYEKFKCSFCEFQSAGVVAMRNHERRHRGEKPFVCEACGAKFHAAYLLAQHKQSHRTEKLAKCDQCPATFKANNSLHMHKITCHSNTLYKCTMCARAYSCRHYAVKHLRHVHRYKGPVPPLERVAHDEV